MLTFSDPFFRRIRAFGLLGLLGGLICGHPLHGFGADLGPGIGAILEAVPCATAHYSFGTAVSSDRRVLFTEFNHRQIQAWSPADGRSEVWRASKTPGMFCLAAGLDGDVFVGLDLGDAGNPGKVLRIQADRREDTVIQSIRRPRQLACDTNGNLFVALEEGRILKWDRKTHALSEVMRAVAPLSGIAVANDGTLYVSEYGRFESAPEGYARPSEPGRVKVRTPDGVIRDLSVGYWRARGLTLHRDSLYLCTEADREDHGNSGLLVSIDVRTGKQHVILDALDYPQFPSSDSTGRVYFTVARDNRLMALDPGNPFREAAKRPGPITRLLLRGGEIEWGQKRRGPLLELNAQSIRLTGRLVPGAGRTRIEGWMDIPAQRFELSTEDLYPRHDGEHPSPGMFELPKVEARCTEGLLTVEVFPLRRHEGCRWPMVSPGTDKESPASGFSERPEAFRIYFCWQPRASK